MTFESSLRGRQRQVGSYAYQFILVVFDTECGFE